MRSSSSVIPASAGIQSFQNVTRCLDPGFAGVTTMPIVTLFCGMLYVIEGTGRMIVDGKEIDINPGTIIMNPMGKIHSMKNTSNGEIVVFQVFTPAWKEPDRVPVP